MPPRLASNPNNATCPDYTLDAYAALRAQTAPGADPAVAAQRLTAIWEAGNTIEKGLWAQQVADDEAAAAEENAARQAHEQQLRLEAEQREEEERLEIEKKKPKAPDFDEDVSIPNLPILRPSPYAINKLRLFEYVELWYFTREGCLDATNYLRSISEEAFGLTKSEDGLALKSLASHKPSKKAIPDEDLTWSQMSSAKTVYIMEIERLKWPQKHRQAIQEFFYALDMHPYRSRHEFGEAILLRYQANSRRLWHEQLKIPGGSFNLRHINDALLDHMAAGYILELQMSNMSRPSSYRDYQNQRFGNSSRRERSPSPPAHNTRRRRSASPHRATHSLPPKPTNSRYDRRPGPPPASFPRGAHATGPIVCAICLGRREHIVSKCTAPVLWNGAPSRCRRSSRGQILNPLGFEICLDWQRSKGCSSRKHPEKHECSGCGLADHGASTCPIAEKI